ncbi:MAG: FAD-dependent thymidylate synthase, partial [Armatimonadetes bacterium]|nr:FAD-dependent thymidylate synthase [Armatimonadota bacterium]
MSEFAALRPYVTNLERPVFALRNLPEEVVAVLFAYYSRSTDSLRDNLRKLIEAGDLALTSSPSEEPEAALAAAKDKARQFHEKWVVGYGHGSVAEHAVVHLAIEEISIVATKALEDNRLASYTEKSTRYVPFDADSFVRDPQIAASPEAALYDRTCRHLLGTYTRLMPTVIEQVSARFARPAEWPERRYQSVCRAKAFDLLRYLLPAATRTNVGLTINGRALEHLLTKLYSHPLGELRELAGALHREAEQIVPTLIKYAARNEYQVNTTALQAQRAAELLPSPDAAPQANG